METGTAYYKRGFGVIKYDTDPNWDHIATINSGKLQGVPVEVNYIDPRKVRPRQRRLYFALLGDIVIWSGEPKEMVDEHFREAYWEKTLGKSISLRDGTQNTVSEAKQLIDLVIDFIFAYRVPVRKGYELLPRDEEYFQYKCLMNKQCLICGEKADTHHVDAVGMGRDRNHIDHTKHRLMALCRVHHTEYHKIGKTAFCNKYHLSASGIHLSADDLKKIGVRGDYEQAANK